LGTLTEFKRPIAAASIAAAFARRLSSCLPWLSCNTFAC